MDFSTPRGRLLRCLTLHRGLFVCHQDLNRRVFGSPHGMAYGTTTIRHLVLELRQRGFPIENRKNLGYRLLTEEQLGGVMQEVVG